MALFTTLAALSQTAGANPPDGSADAPSTIPTDLRLLGSFDAIMRDGGHQWGSTVTGTNTIAITVNGISSLVAGQTYRFVAAGANTGAVTLNVNSLGAKNVNKHGASALAPGDIANLSTVTVTWDGTNFQLVGVAQSALLSSNGWAKFSNGLIVQWGSTSSVGTSSGNAAISYPINFPAQTLVPFAAVQGSGAANSYTVQIGTATTTTLSMTAVVGGAITGGVGIYWLALGS